jgi:hypothetical protein
MARQVFVFREFPVDHDGKRTVFRFTFYRPVRSKSSYRCSYEIRINRAVVRTSFAGGADGVQAFLHAIARVVMDLEHPLSTYGKLIPELAMRDMYRQYEGLGLTEDQA